MQRIFPEPYPATFLACFLTFAHRFFAAFTIAALPAADSTFLRALDFDGGGMSQCFCCGSDLFTAPQPKRHKTLFSRCSLTGNLTIHFLSPTTESLYATPQPTSTRV
jgi:hypothetical protein